MIWPKQCLAETRTSVANTGYANHQGEAETYLLASRVKKPVPFLAFSKPRTVSKIHLEILRSCTTEKIQLCADPAVCVCVCVPLSIPQMVWAPGLSRGSIVTASELERMGTQRISGSCKQPWIMWAVSQCSKAQSLLSKQCVLGLETMAVPGRITFQYSQSFLVLKLQFISCILFSESLLSRPVGRVFLIPFSNKSPALKPALSPKGPKTYRGKYLTAHTLATTATAVNHGMHITEFGASTDTFSMN